VPVCGTRVSGDQRQPERTLAINDNLRERTLRAIALGRNSWGVIGSETGGKTAAVLYTMVAMCNYLGIDPFVYLREALPGLFALGDKPTKKNLFVFRLYVVTMTIMIRLSH
jgi:hypothetical protein